MTRAALIAYQSSQALSPSGTLDPDTRESLATPPANIPALPNSAPGASPSADLILRLGSRGPGVEARQRFLIAQDLPSVGSPDGHFGPLTRAATVLFQRAQALVPDGVVGPKTRAEAEALGLPAGASAGLAGSSPALQRMRNQELTADVIQQAARLLYEHAREPIGTEIPFESAGRQLIGKLEWHYDERRGKHKGLSVFVVG
jgi:peptidoglycan hydrolase-like protein with peptidoglycan-binding domain